MKHIFLISMLSVAAAGFVACGTESNDTDVSVVDTGTDANDHDYVDFGDAGDVPGHDVSKDTGSDTAFDTASDTTDSSNPDGIDSVDPDECQTEYDCDNCDICTEVAGVKKCVTPPEAGRKECYSHEECGEGRVCHADRVGKVECGGSCGPTAVYDLHEWGVNIVTIGGGATVQAGPDRFYGAMAAKPVIYIYSDEQFVLDVGVRYKSGVTYETWPVIPNSADVVWEGVNVGTTTCETTPTPEPDLSGMAEVPQLEIYDLPEWVVSDANCLTYGETVSKVLFYTGPITGYTPGVEAEAAKGPDSKVTFSATNKLSVDVGKVLFLYRNSQSTCVDPSYCPVHTADLAFATIDGIQAGATEDVTTDLIHLQKEITEEQPYPSVEADIPQGWFDMATSLRSILTDAGLTSDEADVFMEAWNETMFGLMGEDANWYYPSYHNGAFMIYLWPSERAEDLLPMTLVPEATTKKRAIVEYQELSTVSGQI